MDENMCVFLLLTGFCVSSASSPNNYYFVKEEMTWNDAQDYCISKYTQMATIRDMETLNALMDTPTGGYADKAWIGLYQNISEWTWVDGLPVTYSSWRPGQPDNTDANKFCACLTDDGSWMDYSCSEKKRAVCLSDGDPAGMSYFITEAQMTWSDAKTCCEEQGSILVIVPEEISNENIRKKMENVEKEVWIGLNRPELWYWSDTGESASFLNWQSGQPDHVNGEESCAAAELQNGTWTDEDCNTMYPFFCFGTASLYKTVVRMEIQSSANMEDPASSADLQQKVHAAFVEQGVTDFRLTWMKQPVKQTEKESSDDCMYTQ